MYPSPFKSVFTRHTFFSPWPQVFQFCILISYLYGSEYILTYCVSLTCLYTIRYEGFLNHGSGKVAVFGEAAMFTAQVGRGGPMGMNDPEAQQNSQFVLNVLHWLTGSLPEAK